jgi:hypothetical protein
MTQDLKADDGQPPRKHRSRVRPAPLHHIEVSRHALPPRWLVPDFEVTLPATDLAHAREEGVRAVHRQIGAPPWLPLQRISLEHATAEPVIAEPAQATILDSVAA